MVSPQHFYAALAAAGVDFLSGVPDSLLKDFCAYVDMELPPLQHVIAANEGAAVGLAIGHHLATGGLPLVYMQNSGLGNAVNPLLSLADSDVYGFPIILLIGWRGEPGVHDEPQHVKQGRVTLAMLESMGIPFKVVDGDPDAAIEAANWSVRVAREHSAPVALVVRKGAFAPLAAASRAQDAEHLELSREAAVALVTRRLPAHYTIVATTGMIARELYEQRGFAGQDRASDFLTVGGMGHASQIALGIARTQSSAQVLCLDGDGASLMHMGGMATIGTSAVGNLLHIVLNNGAHDSVGGQPTVAQQMSLTDIARACGYDAVEGPFDTEDEVGASLKRLIEVPGRRFLEIRVRRGSRSDLGRPKESPAQNKSRFMQRLGSA